jgi:hypothetical protein
MTIDDLIRFLQARLATLNQAKSTALILGNIEHLDGIDADISKTQCTLDLLKNLP